MPPTFHSRLLLLACCVTSLGVAFTPARSQASDGLLGYSWGLNFLYDVDVETGAASNPVRLPNTPLLVGIAFDEVGTLYGLTTDEDLVTIDPATGTLTLVGDTGLRFLFEGDLAFDPTTGLLYGAQDVPTGDEDDGVFLFTLDTASGLATLVGDTRTSDLSALAFDADGRLLGLDAHVDELLVIDETNGSVTRRIPLSQRLGTGAGMVFTPGFCRLLVADGLREGTNQLHELDAATGSLTPIGSTGVPAGLIGLTFDPVAVGEDGDSDGVPDSSDACGCTEVGASVDPAGCSLEQRCPCDAGWAGRGEYLHCVARSVGHLDAEERGRAVAAAARARCGGED